MENKILMPLYPADAKAESVKEVSANKYLGASAKHFLQNLQTTQEESSRAQSIDLENSGAPALLVYRASK